MRNFEFKSAICTSVEQSKRLLELGLKKETADVYHDLSTGIIEVPYAKVELKRELKRNDVIPAWSLHRLMEIGEMRDIGFCDISKAYDTAVRVIECRIHAGFINPEYLE